MSGHVYRRCPKIAGPIKGKRVLAEKACKTGRCEHRWAYTFSFGSDPATGERRQYTGGGFRTMGEAKRALTAAKAKADTGELVTRSDQRALVAAERLEVERQATGDADALTCAQWWSQWLDLGVGPRGTRWKPNTVDSYRAIVDHHLIPRLGDVALADLTDDRLQALLDELGAPDVTSGKHRTRQTCARVRAVLTASMKAAKRRKLIPIDPSVDLVLTGAESNVRKIGERVWSKEQAGRFLAVTDRHPLGAMFRLELATGMRRGELCGLRDVDLDLDVDKPRIRVVHTITQRGGTLRSGAPKTKAGERSVWLDAATVEVLRRQRRVQAARRLRAGPAWSDEGLVFTREDGTAIRPDTISKTWRRLCAEAKVPVIRLHDGRHTSATFALEDGEDIKVVSDQLGHSAVGVTQNIYQHVTPDIGHASAKRRAAWMPAPAAEDGS